MTARRSLAILVAALLSWFWLAVPSALAPAPAPRTAVVHTYDTPRQNQLINYTASERGPPTSPSPDSPRAAVGHGSDRTSARPSSVRTAATYDYDDSSRLVHGDSVTEMTSAPDGAIDGDLSSVRLVGVAANGGMAGVRATGAAGEAAAGILKNTTRIPSASGKAAYRIPDELNSSVLGEVKNVKSFGWSGQISDFYSYASARGLEFRLYVRPDTVFRGQLAELYRSGGFTRVDVPGMGP